MGKMSHKDNCNFLSCGQACNCRVSKVSDEIDALEKLCDKQQKIIDKQLQRHQEFTDLYDTLCDEARWQGAELCEAKARIAELEAAIVACLEGNGHLADGENCTLIDLKQAVPEWKDHKLGEP
jgi:transcription elongation factor Elf1